MTVLTAGDLADFRRLRNRYLRYGKRAISGAVEGRYNSLNVRVRRAVSDLPEEYQHIARLYWIDALTCVAISFRTYYSERHVRRLKNSARSIMLSETSCDTREHV